MTGLTETLRQHFGPTVEVVRHEKAVDVLFRYLYEPDSDFLTVNVTDDGDCYTISDNGIVGDATFLLAIDTNDRYFTPGHQAIYERLATRCGCSWNQISRSFETSCNALTDVPSAVWAVAHAAWWTLCWVDIQ